MQQFSTGKVLVNLATMHFLMENVPEALKYYKHSLEVLVNIEDQP
jgi:hypothetical protein